MKKWVLLSIMWLVTIIAIQAQDVKDATSKMDAFASKKGVIIRFEDYKLENIKLLYGVAEAKIRQLHSGGETKFFYQISMEGKYDTKTASIAYEDLLEVQKALSTLQAQVANDSKTASDYLENKFITDDGFQVGYYVSKGKIAWYMVLEKYGKGNTAFPQDADVIIAAFQLARQKIESLQ